MAINLAGNNYEANQAKKFSSSREIQTQTKASAEVSIA
jgi:hypothetical protein